MGGKKQKNPKKKEYFTFIFLPGPHARVRTLRISKSLFKAALLSLAGVLVLSVYLLYEYHEVTGKAGGLESLREELMQQKAQVQSFALNMNDCKRQMFLIRDLDSKLRQAACLSPRDKAQQLLGIGGADELGLQDLAELGEKKQDEALKEMHQELTELRGAASKEETSLQTLMAFFEDKRSLYASTPALWPVRGWVTSPFGNRTSPLSGKRWKAIRLNPIRAVESLNRYEIVFCVHARLDDQARRARLVASGTAGRHNEFRCASRIAYCHLV